MEGHGEKVERRPERRPGGYALPGRRTNRRTVETTYLACPYLHKVMPKKDRWLYQSLLARPIIDLGVGMARRHRVLGERSLDSLADANP